jgi:nicotinamidase-related amidase
MLVTEFAEIGRASLCAKTSAVTLTIVAAAIMMSIATPIAGQTIIDEWATVKAPPPPELKTVTTNGKAALLLLDFLSKSCGARPRCLASVPKVQKTADEARAKGILVVHSLPMQGNEADLLIPPRDGEPIVMSGANKFHRTDLEKILKDKGITTVIVTGTAAHGAVLSTATAAALLNFKVIVPVDGMSADDLYPEQYAIWHLANAPGGIGSNVTLSKLDMIKF